MKTPAVLLCGALAFAGVASLSAQTAASNETTPVLKPAPRESLPPLSSNRPRLMSPETASKLGVAQPQFSPKGEAKEAEPSRDLREVDKPRNGIIRLPPHVVHERKMPILKERDILTPQGKLELALKRHPGLRLRIPFLPFLNNNGIAMAMIEEEFRLERIAEMNDLVGMMSITDPAGGNAVKKGAARGFLRSNDWISYGGSHGLWRASGSR